MRRFLVGLLYVVFSIYLFVLYSMALQVLHVPSAVALVLVPLSLWGNDRWTTTKRKITATSE